jgi:large subunit ribosomal protein L25
MAEAATMIAEPRKDHGKRRVRRLRKAGYVPAVMYGHKEETLHLTVEQDAMWAVIRHGVRVIDVQVGGKTQKCLIKEIQWDAFGRELVHVDFTRVSADERIRVTVPVQVRGTAPGVNAGGVLNQPMHTLEIECLAINVPDAIRVSVNELQLEQAIHLKEVALPEGVKTFADPEAIVVQCVKPLEEVEAAPAVAVEGPAEPEVIGRKVAEEAEAEPEKKPEKK